MRKALIAAIVLAFSTLAHAGPYSDAARVQQGCQAAGEIGSDAYAARPPDASSMSKEDLQSAAKAWMQQLNLLVRVGGGPMGRIVTDSVMHAFVSAADAKDAYMYGWSHCMDEYGPQ